MPRQEPDITLITGFPAFTVKRMVRKLVAADPRERVYLLVRDKFQRAAEEFIAELGPSACKRVAIVLGDVCDMDLGLSGAEFKELTAELTAIHHLASIYYLGARREIAERVNVQGTRAMIELAMECGKLRRFCHYSTAQVSGERSGVILEEELETGQRFRNYYEETKCRGEELVAAAAKRLPITILRPGVIVGDSKTGEIDKFDGPYYLIVLIVASKLDLHLPLPGRGSAPLHVVPIDFVVDAAWALSRDPRAEGKTFHLTDPAPFAARSIYEMIARKAEKKPPRGTFPTALARAFLRTPGLRRIARVPLSLLESFNHMAIYNCRNTLALLEGTSIRCPPFDEYVDALVRYVREVHAARRQKLEEEIFDPFE